MKKYALLLLLAGCSGHPVSKPGATQAQMNQDAAECQLEEDKVTNDTTDWYLTSKIYNDCLAAKGYR